MGNNKIEIKETYYENGNLEIKEHFLNGHYHNPNGPAVECYYENGQLELNEYYLDGKLHNTNGAAREVYSENGQLEYKAYYVHGQEILNKEIPLLNLQRIIVEIDGKRFKLSQE